MKTMVTLDGKVAHVEIDDPYEGFMLYSALSNLRNVYLNEVLKGSYIAPGGEVIEVVDNDPGNTHIPKRNLQSSKNVEDEMFYFEQLHTITRMMYDLQFDHNGEARQRQAAAFFEDGYAEAREAEGPRPRHL
jgi:hypothetical protein